MTAAAAKGVGFIKEIFVAAVFGIADALDVYLLAFVMIGFPVNILLNAVQTAMIASLCASQSEPSAAGRAYTATLLATLMAAAAVLPIWLFAAHVFLPKIAAGFSPDKLAWLEQALMWMVPYYFLNTLNLLGYGVLQAQRRFVLNSLFPALTPLVTIPLVYFSRATPTWEVLIQSLAFGAALECIAINIIVSQTGYFRRPNFRDPAISGIVRGARALLPGTMIMAAGALVEQSIAAALDSGAVAVLAYGMRLPAALNGIIITAVGTTILPYFAALLADGKIEYCMHSLWKIARWLLFLGGAAGLVLVLASESIVTGIYQRGMFDAAATGRVYPVQQVYFLLLPFALLGTLGIRTLLALHRNGVVSALAALGVLIHIALGWVLSSRYGPIGIALGVAVSTTVVAVAALVLAHQYLKEAKTARGDKVP